MNKTLQDLQILSRDICHREEFAQNVAGERDDWQHPEHVERHEHRPPPPEPDLGQDQRQGQQRHHESQDGKRARGRAHEIRSFYWFGFYGESL